MNECPKCQRHITSKHLIAHVQNCVDPTERPTATVAVRGNANVGEIVSVGFNNAELRVLEIIKQITSTKGIVRTICRIESHIKVFELYRVNLAHRKRLTPDEVREIRRLREKGLSYQKIADELEMSTGSVETVVKGRRYGDVV